MGKSVAAALFRKQGVPVWDADRAVHKLLAKGGAAAGKVSELFPEANRNGAIDRRVVANIVFKDPSALRALEAIIHPLTWQDEAVFLKRARINRAKIIVLDIPLLFELGRETAYDAVVVVTAPAVIQRQRALKRPGMTEEKLRFILAKQIPDKVKRQKADIIIDTSLGKAVTYRQIRKLIRNIRKQNA